MLCFKKSICLQSGSKSIGSIQSGLEANILPRQELQIMLHLHRKAEIEILSAEAGEQDGLIRYVEACITKRLSVESQ